MNVINMEINIFKKNFSFVVLLFIFFSENLSALENKIIYKIDNKIITSIDIENEKNYLIALNPNLKNLNNKEIIEISKKSIVREKIKEIEIRNQFKNINFPEEFLGDLIKNIYSKIEKKNLEEFKQYLDQNNVEYKNVVKKIETEALWNELIFAKFSEKVKINEEKLKEQLLKNKETSLKSYLMSEIVFEVSKSENMKIKHQKIIKTINDNGFENAALKYSISATNNIGGKLDWINENSLNKNIRNTLKSKKVNEFTDPITVPGGFLILKINDIKFKKLKINVDVELKKLISVSKNNQLNQFSKIYFNKIKKNIQINEL